MRKSGVQPVIKRGRETARCTTEDSFRGGLQSEAFIEIEKYCGKAPDGIKQQILASMGNYVPPAQNAVVPTQQLGVQQNQVKASVETAKPAPQVEFNTQLIVPVSYASFSIPAKPLESEMVVVPDGRFYDKNYHLTEQREHIGTDYRAGGRTVVFATHSGNIFENRNSPDPFQAVVIVKNSDGSCSFYGHIESTLSKGTPVVQGKPIGAVKPWNKAHLHYGENKQGCVSVMEKKPADWGWGRVPEGTPLSEIKNRGWVDTQETYGWGSSTHPPVMATQYQATVAAVPTTNTPTHVQPQTQPALQPVMQTVNPSQRVVAPVVATIPVQPPAQASKPQQIIAHAPLSTSALQFNGFVSNYSTTSTPYQPTISLSGSGFNSVTQISWTCAMPNGASCGAISPWTSANWNGKFIRYSDTSAVVAPMLLVTTDPKGTYRWTATFYGAGQPVVRSFAVTKN